MKVDYLVIGTGVAGLSFALKASKFGKVCMIAKDNAEETSTKYAQGGIAAVMYDPDTYAKHIKDTMIAGCELSDPEIVRITITESTARVKELVEWGVDFDKNRTGKFDLAREGGHSEFRVLHHKDETGLEIEQNKAGESWSFEKVDARLKGIMETIFENIYNTAKKDGRNNDFVYGANKYAYDKLIEEYGTNL